MNQNDQFFAEQTASAFFSDVQHCLEEIRVKTDGIRDFHETFGMNIGDLLRKWEDCTETLERIWLLKDQLSNIERIRQDGERKLDDVEQRIRQKEADLSSIFDVARTKHQQDIAQEREQFQLQKSEEEYIQQQRARDIDQRFKNLSGHEQDLSAREHLIESKKIAMENKELALTSAETMYNERAKEYNMKADDLMVYASEVCAKETQVTKAEEKIRNAYGFIRQGDQPSELDRFVTSAMKERELLKQELKEKEVIDTQLVAANSDLAFLRPAFEAAQSTIKTQNRQIEEFQKHITSSGRNALENYQQQQAHISNVRDSFLGLAEQSESDVIAKIAAEKTSDLAQFEMKHSKLEWRNAEKSYKQQLEHLTEKCRFEQESRCRISEHRDDLLQTITTMQRESREDLCHRNRLEEELKAMGKNLAEAKANRDLARHEASILKDQNTQMKTRNAEMSAHSNHGEAIDDSDRERSPGSIQSGPMIRPSPGHQRATVTSIEGRESTGSETEQISANSAKRRKVSSLPRTTLNASLPRSTEESVLDQRQKMPPPPLPNSHSQYSSFEAVTSNRSTRASTNGLSSAADPSMAVTITTVEASHKEFPDYLPLSVKASLDEQVNFWTRKIVNWTTSKPSGRCLHHKAAGGNSNWVRGKSFACNICEKRRQVCVVIRKQGEITLLPVYQEGGKILEKTDVRFWYHEK